MRSASILLYYLKKKREMRTFTLSKVCFDRLRGFDNPQHAFLRACGGNKCELSVAVLFNNCITDFFYEVFSKSLGTDNDTNKASFLTFKKKIESIKKSLTGYFKFLKKFYLR